MDKIKFLNDITTGKDNQTHDVARFVMVVNAVILIPALFLGIGFYLYGYVVNKPFDMQSFFTAILTYEGGVGALLTSGAAAIYFKRTTEPDGTKTETTAITKGKQPDNITINQVM
jgi:hypothetical protein